MRAYERLLKYAKIDTQSDPNSDTLPSAPKELDLTKLLQQELKEMGIESKISAKGYLYACLKGNVEAQPIGFLAHVDTAQGITDMNCKPRIEEHWDGKDIKLNEQYSLSLNDYPVMRKYIGKSLMVTGGDTLLGADDKAGVAEIMTLAEKLTKDPSIKHGDVWIAFTPDEEIGRGTEGFELKEFPVKFAYTLDGDAVNGIEYENFNAASAVVEVTGKLIHTGDAKGKMINSQNIAIDFHNLLPVPMRPEYTEKREGFFHLDSITGDVEKTTMYYLIRNHDKETFEKMKRLMIEAEHYLNSLYPQKVIKVTISDTYANMLECFKDKMYIIDLAKEAMKKVGLEPYSSPIRGGTDGASLSYMGIPCPNLGTGGGNYHGRYEYAVIEDMDKAVEVIEQIVGLVADKQ